jgi:hypothetical protein
MSDGRLTVKRQNSTLKAGNSFVLVLVVVLVLESGRAE